MLQARSPHFLAVHHVTVAFPDRDVIDWSYRIRRPARCAMAAAQCPRDPGRYFFLATAVTAKRVHVVHLPCSTALPPSASFHDPLASVSVSRRRISRDQPDIQPALVSASTKARMVRIAVEVSQYAEQPAAQRAHRFAQLRWLSGRGHSSAEWVEASSSMRSHLLGDRLLRFLSSADQPDAAPSRRARGTPSMSKPSSRERPRWSRT